MKDFSSTIAKHASLAEAVARAGRIHQTLATDIENEGWNGHHLDFKQFNFKSLYYVKCVLFKFVW